MNSTCAQNSIKTPKRGLCSRTLPATLIILLFTAVPALAEPVRVNQVVQTLTSSQGVLDLRLNTLAQDPKGTQQNGPGGETVAKTGGPKQTGGKPESVISSVVVVAGTAVGVEDIEEGEVEGTICDCGEIFIAGAAFPKWPLLFLAAVPVVFINDCCDETESTPTPTPPSTPTPNSTPTPTPEPASLLMLGSGLLAAGAGLRRRHAKSKALEEIKEDE
jgi:hypothetical protein